VDEIVPLARYRTKLRKEVDRGYIVFSSLNPPLLFCGRQGVLEVIHTGAEPLAADLSLLLWVCQVLGFDDAGVHPLFELSKLQDHRAKSY